MSVGYLLATTPSFLFNLFSISLNVGYLIKKIKKLVLKFSHTKIILYICTVYATYHVYVHEYESANRSITKY